MDHHYEWLINGINNGTIVGFFFYVNGYAHYKKCSIFRKIDKIANKKEIVRIEVNLTDDGSEMYSFLKVFQEDFKLFNMGRKGRFTLKQLWNYITVVEVVNSSS